MRYGMSTSYKLLQAKNLTPPHMLGLDVRVLKLQVGSKARAKFVGEYAEWCNKSEVFKP